MFDDALKKFQQALQEKLNTFPNAPTVLIGNGTKYIRIIIDRDSHQTVYCFVEKSTGNLLKAASWKAPEPRKHRRGNIYQENNLEGCERYGLTYMR